MRCDLKGDRSWQLLTVLQGAVPHTVMRHLGFLSGHIPTLAPRMIEPTNRGALIVGTRLTNTLSTCFVTASIWTVAFAAVAAHADVEHLVAPTALDPFERSPHTNPQRLLRRIG